MEIGVTEETNGKVPVTVFHIKGDLDVQTSPQLESQARQHFEKGMRRLLLDLGDVRYVASSGLRAVSSIFNMLRSASPNEKDDLIKKGMRDGTYKSALLKISRANPTVTQAFTLAGYDMFLEMHPDLEDAIRSFVM